MMTKISKLLCSFALIFSILPLAQAETLKLDGKDFKFVQVDKALVSESCLKNKKCMALEILHSKPEEKKFVPSRAKNPLADLKGIHPASEYCAIRGGRGYVYTSSKGGQRDICEFSDKSRISSWDLYDRHHKKVMVQ